MNHVNLCRCSAILTVILVMTGTSVAAPRLVAERTMSRPAAV